jgi:hypothetical protein
MERIRQLLESYDQWTGLDDYEPAELAEQGITGPVAAMLAGVGSGELVTAGGALYHLLDPDGVVYWSRDVLEKLQPIAQPDELHTFMTDEGGGTYVFTCSNGVYVLHHARGLLAHHEDIPSFFEHLLRTLADGAEPFEEAGDSEVIEKRLREARTRTEPTFEELIAGTADADFVPYDPHVRLEKGDLIRHATKGKGIVTAVKTTMFVQVAFYDGKATLNHKGW